MASAISSHARASSSVVPFAFDGIAIRVVSVDGEPWFVAKDVAEALGYADTKKAVAAHCKAGISMSEGGRIIPLVDLHPHTVLIPERDVYRLVMRSHLPAAERFEEWVVGEVLPSIRQRGTYTVAPVVPQTYAEALRLAADQAEQIERQQEALAIAAPKVEFYDDYVDGHGLKGFREVAKLLGANEADFRTFLMVRRVMYRLGGKWTAYQNHIDAGRFAVKTGQADNGHVFTDAKFTPKGVQWVAGQWAVWNLEGAL